MECSKCGGKWDVSKEMESKIKSCPFCGAQISLPEKSNVTFTEVVPCFKHIFKTYGTDIVENKGKFLGLLSDFFPSGKAEIRLIKIALDAGVYAKFSALKENEIEGQKLSAIMLLTDNYFVGKEHAEKVVGWIIDGLYEGYTAKAQQGAPTTAQTAPPQNQQKKKASSTQAKAPAKKQGGAASSAQKKPANASASPAVSTAPPPPPATGSVKGKFTFPEGIYDGEVVCGKRWGHDGTFYYINGLKYKGDWQNNSRHGFGTMYYANGSESYDGEWRSDTQHGWGISYYEDGSIMHKGKWKNGVFDTSLPPVAPDTGKFNGKFLFDNGIYDGDILNGKRHGYGVFDHEEGSIIKRYVGEWQDDKFCGSGVLYFSNGEKQDGVWKYLRCNGCWYNKEGTKIYEGDLYFYEPCGFGTLYYTDGSKYVGQWKDGERHGQGTLFNLDGSVRYQGMWIKGNIDHTQPVIQKLYFGYGTYSGETLFEKPHGTGTLYYADGKTRYEGEWKDGKCHGQGTMFSDDGTKNYQGKWQNGKYHGKGTLYYSNGKIQYEGEWQNSKYHGKGTLYYPNGKIQYEGEWQDGKYHGQGTLYSKLGFKLYSGQWVNGEKAK